MREQRTRAREGPQRRRMRVSDGVCIKGCGSILGAEDSAQGTGRGRTCTAVGGGYGVGGRGAGNGRWVA
jgi:hypothetical protein